MGLRYSWIGRAGLLCGVVFGFASAGRSASIPTTQATALDGHAVLLPRDLPAATVLILGFTRKSADATTAWEKPTRMQFARPPALTFYDMAMFAAVPRFARSFALSRMKKAVPDVLQPNFLPLLDHEAEWKQAAGFDLHRADAAYVLLVDHAGIIRWSSHEAFSPALFAQMSQAAQALATPAH